MSNPIEPIKAHMLVNALSTGMTLTDACQMLDIVPSSVMRLMREDMEFADEVAAARQLGFEFIAERCRSIARGEGGSTNDVQRDKLIIDTDLKLLSKWHPERYGNNPQPEKRQATPQFTETSDPNEASRIYEEFMKNG